MMTDETEIQFDPDFATNAEWAQMYRKCGLQVVPARFPMKVPSDKRPKLADWKDLQTNLADDLIFHRLFGGDNIMPNMGLITGSCSDNIIVVDLDDYKTSFAAAWFREATGGIEPETWKQTTGGGGRQYLFKLPDGVSVGNIRTSLGVDIRGQGGFAMLPPSWHYSGKQYEWVEGCEPWSIPVDTASPDLIAAIQTLIEEHGGSSIPGSTAPVERTASPATDFDAFGNRVDGREEYMTRLVWAAVVDWHRECPIPPTQAEAHAKMREAYAVYERIVRPRVADDGTSKTARLEREGRGPTLFAEKWQNAMRQWDGKVAAHASHAPEGRSAYQKAASETVAFDPETGEVLSETPRPKTRLELIAWDNLPDVKVDWLVKDFLPAGGFAALYGKPGSYKSFVALHLAACVGTGRDMFGRPTTEGDVIYIAGEGGAGLKKRRDAFIKHYGQGAGVRVHFIRAQLNLRSTFEDAQAVIEACQALNLKPALIIIDTLARAFAGGNENASEDMGAFIATTGRLQDALGHPAIVVVHHSGKDEARGMRGHSSLFGAVDTELEVVKLSDDDNPERIGRMTVTKQKDGEDGYALTYRLEFVPLSDIDPAIGSLVVVPDETVGTEARKPKKPRLSGTTRAVLEALQMAIEEGGETTVAGPYTPGNVPCASVGLWREFWRKLTPHDAETADRYFRRGQSDLIAKRTIRVWGGQVWLVNEINDLDENRTNRTSADNSQFVRSGQNGQPDNSL